MTDIKTLNDEFRKTFIGGKVVLTQGICFKPRFEKAKIIELVRRFHNFTTANDPYGEHDFGSFDYKGEKIYFKIDYYDKNFEFLSPDPANPEVTNRVMTIMRADEY